MADSIYINGVDHTTKVKVETLEWEIEANTLSNMDFDFLDTGGIIRPDLSNYVVYTKNERSVTTSTTSGNPVITSASLFLPTDHKRTIVIAGAGPGGIPLEARASYISNSQMSLEFAPSVSVVGASARIGDRQFAGHVIDCEEQAFYADSGIDMHLVVANWHQVVSDQVINAPYVGQTLSQIVTHVYNSVLSGVGLRLDPALASGPVIDSVGYAMAYIDEVFNDLSKRTGWIWYVDDCGVIRFYAPGTVAAPHTITSSIILEGTFKKKRTFNEYRNSQWLWIGGSTQRDLTLSFVGNGVQRRFPLDGGISAIATPPSGSIEVTRIPGPDVQNLPVGIFGVDALEWTWDTTTREWVHTGGTVLDSNDAIAIRFGVQYPIAMYDEDSAEVAARGRKVRVDRNDSIFDLGDGDNYITALLRRYGQNPPIKISFDTYTTGFAPGQTATVNLPNRGISSVSFLIDSVSAEVDEIGDIIYAVTATEGDEFQPFWIEFFKDDVSGGSGSVTYTPAPGGGVSGGGTGAGPVTVTGVALLRFPLGGHNGSYVVAADTEWHFIEHHIDLPLSKDALPAGMLFFVRVHLKTNNSGASIQAGLINTSAGGPPYTSVGNSTLFVSSPTSYTYDGFFVVPLGSEQIYRLAVRTDTPGVRMYCYKATIENR
jgi:hypothetical protein